LRLELSRNEHEQAGEVRNSYNVDGKVLTSVQVRIVSFFVPTPIEVLTGKWSEGKRRIRFHLGFHSFHSGSNGGTRPCVCDRNHRIGQHLRLRFELVKPFSVAGRLISRNTQIMRKRLGENVAIHEGDVACGDDRSCVDD
jgi:hypothetical protein